MVKSKLTVAVTNYNKGPNVDSTMRCLLSLGIKAFLFDPTSEYNFLKKVLKSATHIIFIGHSTDFGTVQKVKKSSHAKLINYWRGGDFWNTRDNIAKQIRLLLTQRLIDDNWAVGNFFANQIRSFGYMVRTVPSIIYQSKYSKNNFNKSVLAYNPDSSGKIGISPMKRYNISLFLELAKALPDYTFYTVGNGKIKNKHSNIIELGWKQNLNEIWKKIDYYYRVTDYEGCPKMIIEAAEYGILSISKYKFFDGLLMFENINELAKKITSYDQFDERIQTLTESISQYHSINAVKKAYKNALD